MHMQEHSWIESDCESAGDIADQLPVVEDVPPLAGLVLGSAASDAPRAPDPESQSDETQNLRSYFVDPEDETTWHPKRLMLTLLGFLMEQVPETSAKRLRVSGKSSGDLRAMLAAMTQFTSPEGVLITKAWRRAGANLYWRVGCFLSGKPTRQFHKEHFAFHQADSAVRDSWALLSLRCKRNEILAKALDQALTPGSMAVPPPRASCGTPSASVGDDPEASTWGFGFLLTYNVNVGQDSKRALCIVQSGLVGKAKCSEFAQLDCYKEVFDDGARWADRLAKDLGFPMVNVGLELSEQSAEPWRVHMHVLVGLDPRNMNTIGQLKPRNLRPSRCIWRDTKPNISPCNPMRPNAKNVACNLAALSYYVVGPKIGQVMRSANIWPITDTGSEYIRGNSSFVSCE